MTIPNTPEQLAGAIECMVASYINDVHRVAKQAVERSFSRSTLTSGPSKSKATGSRQRPSGKRRSSGEIDELGEKLYGLVCTRPGESMVALSDEVGESVCTLQRPMAKLKSEGRVRSVGQRNMMRYYPAVVRSVGSGD